MFVYPAFIPLSLSSNAGVQSKHTHSKRRHRVKSVRYLLHAVKACVNFLWRQKEASVCTAFNNELKGNSGHVTQMKAEMPSVIFFPSLCSCDSFGIADIFCSRKLLIDLLEA